jgi:SAM-dependent methyltransferase
MLKYYLGCGPKHLDGYVNVDVFEWNPKPDVMWDLTKIPYEFAESNSADEIVSIEFLEHISFRYTVTVLKEWKRILKPGGKLIVQVPDCGKAMKYYAEGEICECVPHKAEKIEDYKAKPDCSNCEGRGKINPTRWLFSFTGAQKHFPHDVHKNIFTNNILAGALDEAGFKSYEFKKHPYKLIVEAIK